MTTTPPPARKEPLVASNNSEADDHVVVSTPKPVSQPEVSLPRVAGVVLEPGVWVCLGSSKDPEGCRWGRIKKVVENDVEVMIGLSKEKHAIRSIRGVAGKELDLLKEYVDVP